jgi:hypothetical protein
MSNFMVASGPLALGTQRYLLKKWSIISGVWLIPRITALVRRDVRTSTPKSPLGLSVIPVFTSISFPPLPPGLI